MRNLPIYLTLIFTFLIGTHKGFLALWTQPGGEPQYIFPYSISSLPPEDQKRLETGIRLNDQEALIRLLEDYLS